MHCLGELLVPKIKKILIKKFQIGRLRRTDNLKLIMRYVIVLLYIFVQLCSPEGKDAIRYELCLIGVEIDTIIAEVAAILNPVMKIFPSFRQLGIQFSLPLHPLLFLPILLHKNQLVILLPHQKFLHIQQIYKFLPSSIQLYLLKDDIEIDDIVLRWCDHIDVNVDIFDDGEERFIVEYYRGGQLLFFCVYVSHVQLTQFEGIEKLCLGGLALHCNFAEVEEPAGAVGEGEDEGRTHQIQIQVVELLNLHPFLLVWTLSFELLQFTQRLVLNLLIDLWQREERIEHLPVLLFVGEYSFAKDNVRRMNNFGFLAYCLDRLHVDHLQQLSFFALLYILHQLYLSDLLVLFDLQISQNLLYFVFEGEVWIVVTLLEVATYFVYF